MTAALLSDAALRTIAGDKVFARGQTYAASGAVAILEEESDPRPEVHAQVSGTENYTTDVWIEDEEVGGACDCPHANDGWFCKHQVAVALVWRGRLGGDAPAMDEAARKKVAAAQKRAQTVKDRREALHSFLRAQPALELANKLIELADLSRDVERGLQLWRKSVESTENPDSLKALITETLAVRGGFLHYRDSFQYAQQAEAVLAMLRKARERDARSAVGLAAHALQRCWAALTHADDSSGAIGEVCQAIGTEWIAALQSAGEQPATYGATYLKLRVADPFGCFDADAADKAIGEPALQRYRDLLADLWRETADAIVKRNSERIASRIGKKPSRHWPSRDELDMQLMTLERLHLAELENTGDIDGALAVLSANLSEPGRYSDITQFLEKHGRTREAFANAEAAYKKFPDDWRLEEDLLRLYERDGWSEEALALRRKQFNDSPTVEHYHAVVKAGVAAGKDRSALREELFKAMEAMESVQMRQASKHQYTQSSKEPQREVSLRAAVLCSEQRWDEAYDLVQPPMTCHVHTLRNIALHLDKPKREQAVALLLRIFDFQMPRASTPYRDELQLVREIAERMDSPRRADWLAEIRVTYKAKRNFLRDLPQ